MKTKKILSSVFLILFLGTFTLSAQSKQSRKKEKEKAVKELVDSGNYKIDVSMAYPQRGRSVPLTSFYSLEIRNDSVISHLPFYGRAYSIPYGGGNGLSFKAPVEEYDISKNMKKKKYEVKLKTKTSEDTFQFNIDIFFDGSSNINVNMQNRESIHFSGDIDSLSL